MKKCLIDTEIIDRYFDGKLDDKQMSEIEGHFETCESCRSEFKEIFDNIRLCREIEEELPENFQQELHAKLLALNSPQEKTGHNQIVTIFRNRYFRMAVTAAAVFLLVFLIRGVYFDTGMMGRISGNTTASEKGAADMAAMYRSAAPAPAAGSGDAGQNVETADTYAAAQFGSAEESVGEGEASIMSAGSEIKIMSGFANDAGQNGTQPSKSEADRSTQKSRESAVMMYSLGPAEVENVRSRYTEFVIKEDIYLMNSSVIPEIITTNAGVAKTDPTQYLIPNTNYEQFVNSMVANFGQANVTVYGPYETDMTDLVKSMLSRVDELEGNIKALEDKSGKEWVNEIERLMKEKENLECLIDRIRLENNYTRVMIRTKGVY